MFPAHFVITVTLLYFAIITTYYISIYHLKGIYEDQYKNIFARAGYNILVHQ